MSYLFFLSSYQTKRVIKFLFRQVDDIINFKIYLQAISKAMDDRKKKREDENTKI